MSKMIFLKSSDISFRKIMEKDLKILCDWRNSENVREYNHQFIFLNMYKQMEWYETINKQNSDRLMFMIIYKKKIPVGVCGLINLDLKNRNAEIAIIIGENKMRGLGIGLISLKFLMNYGFKKLGLHRIGAEIFQFNERSVHVFKKAGFEIEATLRQSLWRKGRWWDTYVLSTVKKNYEAL